MGSSSSKFKKYLHHGDEFAAMQVFQSSPELQKNLNPNLSYGEHYNHDTALHFAAKHGMKHLLRTFLNDLGGNPNKKNGSNETGLHAACQLTHNKSFSAMERRATCVMLIIQWRGPAVETGVREKIELNAQDQNGNTALHVAAASGLEHCVETLISAGSSLYVENNDKLTPCDLAVKNGHFTIAQVLESKMVFDEALDFHNEDELSQSVGEPDEVYCGLRTQDLQEAKDQLLVETSDMLQVPLFTAEALLRDNEWSRELLLDRWMKDAVACCQLAGVEPPQSAYDDQGVVTLNSMSNSPVVEEQEDDATCDICMMTVRAADRPSIRISCSHNFCFQCWETYLSNKIIEGMQHNILCPAYQCHILVPIDVIEKLVSPDLVRRYLHFDIKAFVESNKSIKWCPVAGCGRAVRLPEAEQRQPADDAKTSVVGRFIPQTSHAVDCGNGHYFCWECLGEAHAPSGCAQWRHWLEKINQIKPEELSNDMKDLEEASNCLWLVSNSKPCPNCKSPIQKNEGCNHIKCSKCKFDFCWVCLEAWKKHSSATGGYFRCNRFPAVSKADETQGMLISEAVARSQHIQELNRFLHYYTRYKTHEHSRKLEETLLTTVNHKMEVLASSHVNGKDGEKKCTKFIEDGIRELLKARRVLCGSYVHGFYLEDLSYNKAIFEFMQNEFETLTEKLSEMIARPYLKTPRHAIMQTTSLCRKKRHEFVRAVSKGMILSETPPAFRRRKRRFPDIFVVDPPSERDKSQVIEGNPWVKDTQGRHTNLAAFYDWADIDSEEDTEMNRALAVSLVGECSREGCNRPRARNPRNQALYDYCSMRCARNGIQVHKVMHDDSMDLIIALEMSRLQMIEDAIKREKQRSAKSSATSSATQNGSDADLNKAIELSMQQHQQKADVGVTTEDIIPYDETAVDKSLDYYRTNEDITVDCFLKSLAGQDFQGVAEKSVNIFSPETEKNYDQKDLVAYSPNRTEDGRFEISEIHEICFHQDETDENCLRRIHSTGDLSKKNAKKNQYREDPRYHLDSDHSSQHVEEPEEMAKRSLTSAANSDQQNKDKTYQRYQTHSRSSTVDEATGNLTSTDETVSSDSVIADMEVCKILSSGEVADDKRSRSSHAKFGKHHVDDHTKMKKKDSSPMVGNHGAISKSSSQQSTSFKNVIDEMRHTLKSNDRDRDPCYRVSSSYRSLATAQYGASDDRFMRQCPERASTGKIKNSQMMIQIEHQKRSAKSATALESLRDSEKRLFPMQNSGSNNFLFAGSENSLNEAHKKAFKAAGGKILHKKESNLRLRIAKSPIATDSSNEYEAETGIPKSPTLFISGVSISRTPEPCAKDKKSPDHKSRKSSQMLKSPSSLRSPKNYSSPVLNYLPVTVDELSPTDGLTPSTSQQHQANKDKISGSSGRQSRSSSLTHPHSDPDKKKLNTSSGSLSQTDRKLRRDSGQFSLTSPMNSINFERNSDVGSEETASTPPDGIFNFGFQTSDEDDAEKNSKSKSAAEPERDREMFPFPKSSTDGALSSVLHVQENYLSSDDFHEVLFLLERSPKHGSKRKKKSKKERDKIKEFSGKDECAEVSSAL